MSATIETGKWWRAWEWQGLFSYSSWGSGLMCFYICWWSHVASHSRWRKMLHLPGVPNRQIAMARCDSSTITVHEGIPISVLRMKNRWHNSLMSDIWLVSGGIPLSWAADFYCFRLQTAGVGRVGAMMLKWILSQCFLCLCESSGKPELREGIGLNSADGGTLLEARITAMSTVYSADSVLQAWSLDSLLTL